MDQIEAYRQIVQLQCEIVKISTRNSALKQKCSELELELRENRVFPPELAAAEQGPLREAQGELPPTHGPQRILVKYAARIFAFLRPPRNLPA
jgi:hypothetical protein